MLQPGTQIGRYEIQRRLGRGGMGTVYVAHDPVLGRLVAIKLFQAELDPVDAGTRFTREARAAAALNHANIVTIHDFGNHDSQPFIVMEYIQGETLASIIRSRADISLSEKLTWLEQLCAGAAYAHNLGVIHRDIKPTNLIVDRTRRLKILDFGIAKLLGAVASNATTLVGTPGYMAPEQILGEPIDHRSDVFSIGVVAYELLAGVEAFPGESIPAITHRILTQPPKPLADLCPDLPEALIAIVDRAMAKKPDDRFATADAFRTALGAARRDLDADGMETIAQTIIRPSPAPQVRPSTDRPSPGAIRPQAPDPVGTRHNEFPRTDPLRLEHLRTQQVAGSLADARTALAAGDLDRAQNACLQALMLKADDADALALEAEIETAQAKQRASHLVDEAREEFGRGGLTGAFELLEQARGLAPELTELKILERDLRLARADYERLRKKTESVQLAVEASGRALRDGDVEGALAFARQALDLQADSVLAREAEAAALMRLNEVTGANDEPDLPSGIPGATVIAPAGWRQKASPAAMPTPVPAPAPVVSPAAKEPTAKAPASAPTQAAKAVRKPAPVWAAITPQQKKLALIGGAVVLLLIVVAGVVMRPAGPPEMGTVSIDAIPYALVTAIENTAGGERPPVPTEGSTPLLLNLPVGSYRITLTGPPPASESRVITVTVTKGIVTTAPSEKFKGLTPEEYFEPFLAVGSDLQSPTTDAAAGAAPPGPAPAPSQANPSPRPSEASQ